MSYYDIAVGTADDPSFHWEGGDNNGNLPHAILRLGSINAVAHMHAAQLLEREYGGKQLDWSCTGARLRRRLALRSSWARVQSAISDGVARRSSALRRWMKLDSTCCTCSRILRSFNVFTPGTGALNTCST